jgi:class 3 adenylate cyclase
MDRLGDEAGREILRGHERITRKALSEHGGTEVKTLGDGFMASFGSVSQSLRCAQALQHAFESPLESGYRLRVRIGINAGEPIEEEDDLFGTSVIVAARTAASAGGGQIVVTDVVRQLVAGKEFLFADRGLSTLKGFEDPVHTWEVLW